ncbi:MAG: hypothetical protein HY914_00185 [Desulfomonile tiedjei]|nr:hypothetical protein [Desulfomonile tiedjei]
MVERGPGGMGRGLATTAGFQGYELLSMLEILEIEVHGIKNSEQRGGVSELALPSIAPRQPTRWERVCADSRALATR